jgi:hypothetical protein
VYSTASGGQGGRTSDMRRDEQDKSCAARVQCGPGFVAQICVCVDVGLLTRRRSGPWIEWWEQVCRCVVVDLGVYAEETNSQRCIFEVAPSTSNVPSM